MSPGRAAMLWYVFNLQLDFKEQFFKLFMPHQVDTNHGRYVLTSNGDLTIVQVRQTDSGSYVCLASNGLGEPVRREVELQVTGMYIL